MRTLRNNHLLLCVQPLYAIDGLTQPVVGTLVKRRTGGFGVFSVSSTKAGIKVVAAYASNDNETSIKGTVTANFL